MILCVIITMLCAWSLVKTIGKQFTEDKIAYEKQITLFYLGGMVVVFYSLVGLFGIALEIPGQNLFQVIGHTFSRLIKLGLTVASVIIAGFSLLMVKERAEQILSPPIQPRPNNL